MLIATLTSKRRKRSNSRQMSGWFATADSYILYTAVGAIVLGFGVLDKLLREYLFLTEIGVAVLLGVLLGNGFSLYTVVDPGTWLTDTDDIALLAGAARFTLAIQLMTTALQSPDFYYIKTWKALFVLLVPVMTLTFVISGLIAWGILGMGVNAGIIVGGFVAPTGPSPNTFPVFLSSHTSHSLTNMYHVECSPIYCCFFLRLLQIL